MRNRFILSFILLITSHILIAQDSKFDEYIKLYQFDKALRLIENMSLNQQRKEQKVFCLDKLGRYKEAISILENLEKDYPAEIKYKIGLADYYELDGDLKKSEQIFDSLLVNYPENIYFRSRRADLLEKQNFSEKALADYLFLLKKNESVDLYKRIANSYTKLNRNDSAITYHKNALSIDPRDAFSTIGLSNIYLKKGKEGAVDALKCTNVYLEQDSINRPIKILNALSYYLLDDYDNSIERFMKCYNAGDSSLVVVRSLGISYYSLGKRDEAYKFLQKAYALDSTNINVLYSLGITANDKFNYELGHKCFSELLNKTIPQDITLYQYYRNSAIANEGLKNYQDAINDYIQALSYANDNQKMHLYYNIVSIYDVDLKDEEESLKYYILYKKSLTSYYEEILNKEPLDETEIKITKAKLDALDKHIKRLSVKSEMKSESKSTPRVESSIKVNL